MIPFRYSISRPSLEQVVVQLAGKLDEAALLPLETELRVRLAHAPPHQFRVTMDLRDVADYTLFARDVCIRIQRFLTSRAEATAYIADRPNLRALAVWTIRMAGDATARVVDSPEAAAQWLTHGETESDTAEGDGALSQARCGSYSGV